jgi:hypothetical protein
MLAAAAFSSAASTATAAQAAPPPAAAHRAAAAASVAVRQPAYIAPTITYMGAVCTRIRGGWAIDWRWRATGGRYADLGTAQRPNPRGTIVTGGRRTFAFTTTVTGFKGDLKWLPPTETAMYAQMVAPIGATKNVKAWRLLTAQQVVNMRCGRPTPTNLRAGRRLDLDVRHAVDQSPCRQLDWCPV